MNNEHFGARLHEDGKCSFKIFAPQAHEVKIKTGNMGGYVEKMTPGKYGVHEITLEKIHHGDIYSFILDEGPAVPDLASQWQPSGLRGMSAIVDHHSFDWRGDSFRGLPMSEMMIYEIHVATFSPENNFEGIISRLSHLKGLGINTLLLMPVAQFSNTRGWGYDTVYPFAVHNSYGQPDELKKLIRQCHMNNIAVIMDVSFGHLVPPNFLATAYTPFFSEKFNISKGHILNFDERYSCGVREFYIQCALSWMQDYRVDGLRIKDADLILDQSPVHFLEELSSRVKHFAKINDRNCVLINSDKHNAVRPVLPPEQGGYGLDALNNDDFYCALQSRITGNTNGRFKDYSDPERMVSAMQYGFAYRGEISSHLLRLQGRDRSELKGCKFVVYSQGHEEYYERDSSCRIIEKAGFEAAKLSAGATLLSPYVPLIFMGDEYGENAPFYFFDESESDAAVDKCSLNWRNIRTEHGMAMLRLYRELIEIRKEHPAINEPCRSRCQVQEISPNVILILRNPTSGDRNYAATIFNFNTDPTECNVAEHLPQGVWTQKIYSAANKFSGTAGPLPEILPRKGAISMAGQSFALYFFVHI
ncbi:alpha-amylase family glycosyl hydrolase [Maridesulfovibrio sp.]|uniref:alpha-amylase family glycosyl hydrolase n=1 Tax=Maridesulfovibrio sp. TaxID=2795000 RepID=UPI0029CA112A|nr:alpha-amylase family glycosyl hydrolase [Maridesulfovibrio sp.]